MCDVENYPPFLRLLISKMNDIECSFVPFGSNFLLSPIPYILLQDLSKLCGCEIFSKKFRIDCYVHPVLQHEASNKHQRSYTLTMIKVIKDLSRRSTRRSHVFVYTVKDKALYIIVEW